MTDKAVKPEDVLPDGDDFATIKGVRVRKGTIAAAMRNMAILESGTAGERAAALRAIKDLAPSLAALDVHRFSDAGCPKSRRSWRTLRRPSAAMPNQRTMVVVTTRSRM